VPDPKENAMTITALDVNSALIVVDLQKVMLSLPVVHPLGDIVERAAVLCAAFRGYRLPVILVNADGIAPGRTERDRGSSAFAAGWADLLPELDQQPEDLLVTKRTWGAFGHTGLEQRLKQLEVTQVVIAGIATSIGVESTARQAYALGFNVTLAADAMTDLDAEAHTNSLTRIFPRLGETGGSVDIIDKLARSRA
jgi:nicotinamidase-related amidase